MYIAKWTVWEKEWYANPPEMFFFSFFNLRFIYVYKKIYSYSFFFFF